MRHFGISPHLPVMTEVAVQEATGLEGIVRRAAAGDEVAFTRLVAEHDASMLRVAFVIVADAGAANDAVQAAWATAWQELHRVREPRNVRSWLIAVAANEARQALRRRRGHVLVDLSDATDRAGEGDPADAIDLLDLQRALRRLAPDDRSLIAMRYVGGVDSTEIAAQTGISASGVRSRLARVLDRLKADLDHA